MPEAGKARIRLCGKQHPEKLQGDDGEHNGTRYRVDRANNNHKKESFPRRAGFKIRFDIDRVSGLARVDSSLFTHARLLRS